MIYYDLTDKEIMRTVMPASASRELRGRISKKLFSLAQKDKDGVWIREDAIEPVLNELWYQRPGMENVGL